MLPTANRWALSAPTWQVYCLGSPNAPLEASTAISSAKKLVERTDRIWICRTDRQTSRRGGGGHRGALPKWERRIRGCRRGGREAWGRVHGMSGRGYGDYFSAIRSVQMQTEGEGGLHGTCSVGQYRGWMGRGARRGWRQMRRYVGQGGSFFVTQGDVGGCWVRRFVRPSLWWGFILSVCLSVGVALFCLSV